MLLSIKNYELTNFVNNFLTHDTCYASKIDL